MNRAFSRTELLLGEESTEILKGSRLAVFGIGGVGSYVAEVLGRSGVGNLTLIDYDIIDISNINRQIHADMSTIGRSKVEVMKERLLNINPDISIETIDGKYSEENEDIIALDDFDYIVDAIDMVASKLHLIEKCKSEDIDIISAMGAGNKLDPTRFMVGDIYDTKECPLARVMRRELRKRNIEDLKVVWSDEKPIDVEEVEGSRVPGTVGFVPSVMGLIIGGEVIKDIVKGGKPWSR